ncbi:MAG: undecaprenyl-diphosphate phosphatase [Oscillospiraceae bacterium]|nr:undecaprenyl-diphosphate phosphatase [Oscillospiraceae bacterium]
MSIIKAIFSGIIQGLTEFLPISSSGHLMLFRHFFSEGEGGDPLMLTVMLHMGTLLAVLILYRKTLLTLLKEALYLVRDVFKGKFSFENMNPDRAMLIMLAIACVPLLLLMLPVGGGDLLMDKVSALTTGDKILPLGFFFLITAALLIFGSLQSERIKKHAKMGVLTAFLVGFAQLAAAAFPGVSRSGSTISTGMIFGIPKNYMVKFSFVLGIPAILAANLVEFKHALSLPGGFDKALFLPITAGVAAAAISGVIAIKALIIILKRDMFKYFGYYCLVVGVVTVVVGFVQMF